MKFKPNYTERLQLLMLLHPNSLTGSIAQLRVARDIRKKVELSQYEMDAADLHESEQGQLGWNPAKEPEPKEIEFSEREEKLVRKQLLALNAKEMLTAQHIGLYEAFVEQE